MKVYKALRVLERNKSKDTQLLVEQLRNLLDISVRPSRQIVELREI